MVTAVAAESSVMPNPAIPRTYPYEHIDRHWTDDDWRKVPPTWLPINLLTPTQEAVALHRVAHLVNGGQPEGDGIARVIRHDGVFYLHDGHTRWLIAWLRGQPTLQVRIVDSRQW
jgi:hypothetical protein